MCEEQVLGCAGVVVGAACGREYVGWVQRVCSERRIVTRQMRVEEVEASQADDEEPQELPERQLDAAKPAQRQFLKVRVAAPPE